jgi:hypothetical protein
MARYLNFFFKIITMKKSKYITTVLLTTVFIFSACSKNSTSTPTPSVVGTWQLTSTNIVTTDTLNGVPQPSTNRDSTYTLGKAPIIQFTSGNYTLVNTSITPATTESGNYSITGNSITLVPTSGSNITQTGTYTATNTTLTFTTLQSSTNVSQSETFVFTRQ